MASISIVLYLGSQERSPRVLRERHTGVVRSPVCRGSAGEAHSGSLSPAAFLSAQGVHVEHTAQLRGIHFSSSLQQETSDYYRLLTPALQTLVSAAGTEKEAAGWVCDRGGQSVGWTRRKNAQTTSAKCCGHVSHAVLLSGHFPSWSPCCVGL